MHTIRIATRSSVQARTQATVVANALEKAHPNVATELVFVDTAGDQNTETPIHLMGGQGVFVKEVQRAVLDGRADIAVHSAKDLPSEPADGLVIAAFTQRRTPNDALVGCSLNQIPHGGTVATGSVRRRAQLRAVRPDLQFVELRGNIHTRLSKIPENGALVMAVAALEIVELTDHIADVLDLDLAVPMVGQGCVAVEAGRGNAEVIEMLQAIDHAPTRRSVETERAFLRELGAGCSHPIAAHVSSDDTFRAFMAEGDAVVQVSGSMEETTEHKLMGVAVARECKRRLDEVK
jgi:hydroxymethylbilane synthase